MPPSPPIISPDELQPKAYKKYVAASARLYTKSSDDEQWTFTNHKGVIVFGRDRSNLVGGEVSSIGHGTTKSEVHWLRLISAGVTVWTFRIPRQFDYTLEKPFFHTFTGYGHTYGLRFDEDDDAEHFGHKVVARCCSGIRRPPRPRANSFSLKNSIPTAPTRPRKLSTASISAPQPDSFVHVSHLGIDKEGVVHTSKELPSLMGKLHNYNVTDSMCIEQLDFMEGWFAHANVTSGSSTRTNSTRRRAGEPETPRTSPTVTPRHSSRPSAGSVSSPSVPLPTQSPERAPERAPSRSRSLRAQAPAATAAAPPATERAPERAPARSASLRAQPSAPTASTSERHLARGASARVQPSAPAVDRTERTHKRSFSLRARSPAPAPAPAHAPSRATAPAPAPTRAPAHAPAPTRASAPGPSGVPSQAPSQTPSQASDQAPQRKLRRKPNLPF